MVSTAVFPASNSFDLSCQAYIGWKAEFTKVYRHFIPEEPPKSVLPIKIAILDTGIDMEHECIEEHAGSRPERVLGKNWLDEQNSTDLRDPHGHGTHIAGIILDLIPHSQIIVEKVTDGVVPDPRNLARVSLSNE